MEGVLPYVHKALTRRYGHAGNPPYHNLSSTEGLQTLNMGSHYTKLKGLTIPPIPFVVHGKRMSCTGVEEYEDAMSLIKTKASHRQAISCSFIPADQVESKKIGVKLLTIKDI